jgi:hypothetical protein
MKKGFSFLLVVLLLIAILYIIFLKSGCTPDSILNAPKTIELTVDCSTPENMLVTSTTNVTVTNHSTRTHNNVTIRVAAYDKKNNLIKEKYISFERTLNPNSILSKVVTLPARARKCDCTVENSSPD